MRNESKAINALARLRKMMGRGFAEVERRNKCAGEERSGTIEPSKLLRKGAFVCCKCTWRASEVNLKSTIDPGNGRSKLELAPLSRIASQCEVGDAEDNNAGTGSARVKRFAESVGKVAVA